MFPCRSFQVVQKDWLDEMVGHAVQQKVGAVGAKKFNHDGTIKNAGIVTGVMGVSCNIYENSPKVHSGIGCRALLAQNLTAVSADCLLVRKNIL